MSNNLIHVLKETKIIWKEPIVLRSGETSDFYLDVKKAYGYPRAVNAIADGLWKRIDRRATCIATKGYGGLSPASVISSRHDLKLTLARDKPKTHGKGGWIDGYVPNEQDMIALVDDVFTTGSSLKELAKIIGTYVVVKRGQGNLPFPLTYLLTAEDLL